MFTYHDDRESIKAERGFKIADVMMSDDAGTHVLDRWLTRLVLSKYGDTLEKATSPRQLLCAIRDIIKGESLITFPCIVYRYLFIAGHYGGLVEKGILHRDISFSNLLLSPYDLSAVCAVIIDWDLAKKMADLMAKQGTEGDSRTVRNQTSPELHLFIFVREHEPINLRRSSMDPPSSAITTTWTTLNPSSTFFTTSSTVMISKAILCSCRRLCLHGIPWPILRLS